MRLNLIKGYCLILLIFLTLLNAQSITRLDLPGGSMEFVPNRYQIFGTCYANVAVDLVDSYRFKNMKKSQNPPLPSSSLLTSILTSIQKYQKKDKNFLYSWHHNYPNKVSKRPLDGGRICHAFDSMQRNGIYSYKSLEEFIFMKLGLDNDGTSKTESKLEDFIFNELREIFLSKDKRQLLNYFPRLRARDAHSSLKQKHYLAFLSTLFRSLSEKLSFSNKRLKCVDQKISDSNRESMKKFIITSISNSGSSPLALNFYRLPMYDDYVFIEGKKRGAHVVSIIGKRLNAHNRYEVLIKDTSIYQIESSRVEQIDPHHFWVELDFILKNAYRLSYLK